MATQCDPSTSSTFSFEFDFDMVDHTGKNWADDATGTVNAAAYERDNHLVTIHHEDINSNRTWTAGISTAGNIYSFRGPFGEASPPQTNWHPDEKGSLWVDDLPQMGVLADTRTDYTPSPICYNHPNQSLTPLNYNIECVCKDANGADVACNVADATVVGRNRLVRNFDHQGGVYSRDMGEDASGNPFLLKTKDGALAGKPFFSPSVAAHCEGNACSFGTWGQQAHAPTPWRSGVLFFSRFADCGNGVLEFAQAIYNDGDSSGALGGEIYKYGNTPWGGVRTSNLPKMLVSSKDRLNSLNLTYDQVDIKGWGLATCPNTDIPGQGRDDCYDKLCMDVACTAGYTTFAQDIDGPPVAFDKVCINATSGDATRSETCDTGLNEFNPVMLSDSPCSMFSQDGLHPGRVRCNVYRPSGDDENATVAALLAVNNMNCANCRLDITVRRPNVTEPITTFTIRDLDHITFTGGDVYQHHYTYFTPLDVSSDAEATAWSTNLNNLLNADDIFYFDWNTEGTVDTNDAVALTYIHGRDTTMNGGVDWERARAGMSIRDYTVWTVNPIGISINAQDTYAKKMYLSTDKLTSVATTASAWVDKTDEEFINDPSQFNGRAIQLYAGSNNRFGAAAADAPSGLSTSCPNMGDPVCSGWSTPKAGYKCQLVLFGAFDRPMYIINRSIL